MSAQVSICVTRGVVLPHRHVRKTNVLVWTANGSGIAEVWLELQRWRSRYDACSLVDRYQRWRGCSERAPGGHIFWKGRGYNKYLQACTPAVHTNAFSDWVVPTLYYPIPTAVNKVLGCLSLCLHPWLFGFETVNNLRVRDLISWSWLVILRYGSPSAIRTTWGRGGSDYRGIRITEGTIRVIGNIQKIITQSKRITSWSLNTVK
jgi:hypothetical protein